MTASACLIGSASKNIFHLAIIYLVRTRAQSFLKSQYFLSLIRTRTLAYQGIKNASFFGKFPLRTKLMICYVSSL